MFLQPYAGWHHLIHILHNTGERVQAKSSVCAENNVKYGD